MKNKKWLYWLVALLLVAAAGYSVIHVHKAEQANSVKMAKQASIDKKRDQKIAKQKKDQKQRARKPVDWSKPSLTGEYPDLTPYRHIKKKKDKVWLDVSVRKQRVYVMQGRYILYTMYASIGKNYDGHTQDYQRTPVGDFRLQKEHGPEYYDATKKYGAKYWTSFSGHGVYRFESVPFDKNGKVIAKQAGRLGSQKVTKKHNIKNYGSIRLTVPDAKWLQENIKPHTRVVVHGRKSDKEFLDFLY